MIDMNKSELIETRVAELHSSVATVEEGTPMSFVFEGGKAYVKPSTDTADEKYAGCAIGVPVTPTTVPIVETFVAPASSPYTITLSKTMKGSDIRVVSIAANGTRTAQTAGNPGTTANNYSISNGVITLHSGQAGLVIEVTYKYDITLQEAIMKYRFDGFASINNSTSIGTQGLLTTGRLYTSMFDITVDWHSIDAGTAITIGDGVYTIGGSGTETDAMVIEAPSAANNGLLGLRFHP
jgi:hypothetical protein